MIYFVLTLPYLAGGCIAALSPINDSLILQHVNCAVGEGQLCPPDVQNFNCFCYPYNYHKFRYTLRIRLISSLKRPERGIMAAHIMQVNRAVGDVGSATRTPRACSAFGINFYLSLASTLREKLFCRGPLGSLRLGSKLWAFDLCEPEATYKRGGLR